jgi:hypothetical protein
MTVCASVLNTLCAIDRIFWWSKPAKGARLAMTPEDREQMNRLCQRIQLEKDSNIFIKLVEELNELLEREEKRLESSKAV